MRLKPSLTTITILFNLSYSLNLKDLIQFYSTYNKEVLSNNLGFLFIYSFYVSLLD